MFFAKPKKVASTPFSEFIRNASSGEKKKVYKTVLIKATERQKEVIRRGSGVFVSGVYAKSGVAIGGRRELISPNGDKRLIRRDEQGRIKESDDLGRSLAQDVRKPAKTKVTADQGDRGAQKRK
jgi:hypothetical protein